MKKSVLFLGFLLTLFCLVKCGGPKQCAVNKILNNRVFDPLWTGDCVNDSLEGMGILYDYLGYVKYNGEMKNGSPNGQGTYFDDYIIEGNWIKGVPHQADYYLREVKFDTDYYNWFIEKGLRFKVQQHYSTEFYLKNYFYVDSMLSAIDSLDFVARLEKDTLYQLGPKKSWPLPIVDSAACVSHIFYLGNQFSSGLNTRDLYNFFVVQCRNGGIHRFFRQEHSFGTSSGTTTWKMNQPSNPPDSKTYSSPFALMKHACGCE